jgi:hypothetical protein
MWVALGEKPERGLPHGGADKCEFGVQLPHLDLRVRRIGFAA